METTSCVYRRSLSQRAEVKRSLKARQFQINVIQDLVAFWAHFTVWKGFRCSLIEGLTGHYLFTEPPPFVTVAITEFLMTVADLTSHNCRQMLSALASYLIKLTLAQRLG